MNNTAKSKKPTRPDIDQIFDDLEEYLNYCRFELCRYDPKDLYRKGTPWEEFNRKKIKAERLAKESRSHARS